MGSPKTPRLLQGSRVNRKGKIQLTVEKGEDPVERLLLFPVADLAPVKSDTALSVWILEFSFPQARR